MTFGDNGRVTILGIGKVGKNSTSSIENVYLVDGLQYKLLSILSEIIWANELRDKSNRVWFGDS